MIQFEKDGVIQTKVKHRTPMVCNKKVTRSTRHVNFSNPQYLWQPMFKIWLQNFKCWVSIMAEQASPSSFPFRETKKQAETVRNKFAKSMENSQRLQPQSECCIKREVTAKQSFLLALAPTPHWCTGSLEGSPHSQCVPWFQREQSRPYSRIVSMYFNLPRGYFKDACRAGISVLADNSEPKQKGCRRFLEVL